MIGKMYRPHYIEAIKDGYSLEIKMRTNFNEMKSFVLHILLDYDFKNQKEVLQIYVKGMEHPVALIHDGTAKIGRRRAEITSDVLTPAPRRLQRPNGIRCVRDLIFTMPVKTIGTKEKDIITFHLMPVVHEGEDYLGIATDYKGNIQIFAEAKVMVQSREWFNDKLAAIR